MGAFSHGFKAASALNYYSTGCCCRCLRAAVITCHLGYIYLFLVGIKISVSILVWLGFSYQIWLTLDESKLKKD